MPIPGTTPISARIAPTSELDTWATHEAKWGKGGLRTVATTVDRDTIMVERREVGMEVFVVDTASKWRLASDLVSWIPVGLVTGVVDPEGVVLGDNTEYVDISNPEALVYWYHLPADPPTMTGWKRQG